jgi:hypothetical protein
MNENDTTSPPLSAFTNATYVNVKVLDDLKKFEDSYTNYEVPLNTTYEDITYDYTDKEIKEIVKGKAYLSIHEFPVTIAYNFPYKKKAYAATIQRFKTIEEMTNFINNNKGIVIYKIFKRRDETLYGMRYFDGLKFCCKFEYYYSNLLLKLHLFKAKISKFFTNKKNLIMNTFKSKKLDFKMEKV